jgi:plasmid stabilization system protein ParE
MPFRLTADAEADLDDILKWTARRFGARKAIAYHDALLAACQAAAAGSPVARTCREVIAPHARNDLQCLRSGRHFVMFTRRGQMTEVLHFLHAASNLGARLAALDGSGEV